MNERKSNKKTKVRQSEERMKVRHYGRARPKIDYGETRAERLANN